jgi:FlaA1/EpsC-like NDP-sugar epimerase
MLELIGRKKELFASDISNNEDKISALVQESSFLVIGAAGSIGQAVTKEIFKRHPSKLHCVDISENNLVELVRDIRSSFGYIKGDFKTFALDVGSSEFNKMIDYYGAYDYVLNLSALKHVRSEKDPYTLMRMIDVNILNTEASIKKSIEMNSKKYFCVSTDKAANPVNMMGASKRIMELFLSYYSKSIEISTARFANVAFSDGSLLAGFNQRILKKQPIAAPKDVKRYFLSPKESGELCLLSCLLGSTGDIFFPKLNEELNLITFSEIASKYLIDQGLRPYLCNSEKEARSIIKDLNLKKEWPCYFSESSTTGEKGFEEFYMDNEKLIMNKFEGIGIVQTNKSSSDDLLIKFKEELNSIRNNKTYNKKEIVELFKICLPDFNHEEKGRYLDEKM